MGAWMNGHTDRYKAYVCHAGCFDWVAMFSDDAWYWHPKELGAHYWDNAKKIDAQNPRARVKRMKTPTLAIHALLAYRAPTPHTPPSNNTPIATPSPPPPAPPP